jgi:hypothetical protein
VEEPGAATVSAKQPIKNYGIVLPENALLFPCFGMKFKKSTFIRFANSAWRFQLFLLWKLPAAWFMGVRIRSFTLQECIVALPYSWFAQNPFRSTYFAAQCAAGELSTGMLALGYLQEKPPVSMLVTRIEAEFYKKADRTLLFTCSDGESIAAVIEQTLERGEPRVFRAESIARLPDGEVAARIWVEWSFKAK